MNVELASKRVGYERGIGKQDGLCQLWTGNWQARGSVMNVELASKRVGYDVELGSKRVGYERGIGKQEGRL